MRGQYASAVEHAVPEQFWVEKSQCRYQDEGGQVRNPAQTDCAQAVSAVKAIAIAQAEGQRIYTINQSNAATALPKLSIGGDVGAEIRNAIQAGKEVTFHERQISAHGWTGYGYVITDPDTGAGAYLIEGKGNGGILFSILTQSLLFLLYFAVFVGAFALAVLLGALLVFLIAIVIPVLGAMFSSLALSAKLAIIGYGVWTASELLLDGCKKSVGKLVGSVMSAGAIFAKGIGSIAAWLGFFQDTAGEFYKAAVEGC